MCKWCWLSVVTISNISTILLHWMVNFTYIMIDMVTLTSVKTVIYIIMSCDQTCVLMSGWLQKYMWSSPTKPGQCQQKTCQDNVPIQLYQINWKERERHESNQNESKVGSKMLLLPDYYYRSNICDVAHWKEGLSIMMTILRVYHFILLEHFLSCKMTRSLTLITTNKHYQWKTSSCQSFVHDCIKP